MIRSITGGVVSGLTKAIVGSLAGPDWSAWDGSNDGSQILF